MLLNYVFNLQFYFLLIYEFLVLLHNNMFNCAQIDVSSEVRALKSH